MPSGYTSFSPTGRVKRMERKLDQTQKIYDEIIAVAGPKLQTVEGQAILAQSEDERRSVWRTKSRVRKIREGLRRKGWWESKIAPLWKDSGSTLHDAEDRVRNFFMDAVSTSVKAAELIAKSASKDGDWKDDATVTEESTFSSICALMTVIEEVEDASDSNLPGETSFASSEADSCS